MNNRIKIAREFADTISCEDIIKVILFGSVAREEDDDDSDIDILIVINSENPDLESSIIRVAADFLLQKDEIVSPYVMSEAYFNENINFSFLKEVMADGVII